MLQNQCSWKSVIKYAHIKAVSCRKIKSQRLLSYFVATQQGDDSVTWCWYSDNPAFWIWNVTFSTNVVDLPAGSSSPLLKQWTWSQMQWTHWDTQQCVLSVWAGSQTCCWRCSCYDLPADWTDIGTSFVAWLNSEQSAPPSLAAPAACHLASYSFTFWKWNHIHVRNKNYMLRKITVISCDKKNCYAVS